MSGRISNKTKERFKRIIRDVVKGLSRKVLVYKQPILLECPNCYYDKMTSKSTGKCRWTVEEAEQKQHDWELLHPGEVHYKYFRIGRCPVCRGNGHLEIKRKTWVDCLVTWGSNGSSDNDIIYTPAGVEGDTIVQLKTAPKYYELFKDCSKIIVDGVECKLCSPTSLRGLGGQDLLIVVAFTTDKVKVSNGEIIKDYK